MDSGKIFINGNHELAFFLKYIRNNIFKVIHCQAVEWRHMHQALMPGKQMRF